MTQLTIELSDKEFQRIQRAAKKVGKPIEVLIRELISQFQQKEEKFEITRDPLYQFEGFDADAPADLSMNVDKYLYGKSTK
jgi:predicted DNA-binding protein